MAADAVPWSIAWRRAAHGPFGFYGSGRGRAEDHFVTSVMLGDAVATQVIALALPTLAELAARGQRITVTDAGAADGTLLGQLMTQWPANLRSMTDWRGLDVRERPPGVDNSVQWLRGDINDTAATAALLPGLVVAHELLDDVPCDIVEPDEDGRLRLVLVEAATGVESLGPRLDDAEGCDRWGIDGAALADWCARWWPRTEPVARIEVGLSRDLTWTAVGSLVCEGIAIAVDYGHVLADRVAGRWDGGTLAAYVDGGTTRPIPDGRRNITAHVAIDSCAAALPAASTRLVPPTGIDDFWWLVQSRSAVA